MRVLLIDDEELARQLLREYLAAHEEVEIVAECTNGFEAVKALTELQPDLIFLDVQMPKLNGFEVLELVERRPAVIFTTAYDEYALRAFAVHAVDYLLKPFSAERFAEALQHAQNLLGREQAVPFAELATAARGSNSPLERILIREGTEVRVIPVGKIDYLEAQDDYVAIKALGQTHLKAIALAELERNLDARRFVRIHRSYIVNLERIAKIELYAKDSRRVVLNDGAQLPVSRAGYSKLQALI
ncbi:response regulator [candidate division KSB1 bacterium]|nr:response regulator [candidate division KSB1 bacterium]